MMRTAIALVVVALLWAAPAWAQQQLPATLTGESLVGTEVDVRCDRTGAGAFKITFSASGVAAGPYPGTFEERGSFDQTFPQPVTQAFVANFRIDSGDTVVTGVKRFESDSPGAVICSSIDDDFHAGVFGVPSYEATIRTPVGTFRDEGTSDMFIQSITSNVTGDVVSETFRETFTSDLTEAIPLLPARPGCGLGDDNHTHTGPPGRDGECPARGVLP